VSAKAHDNRAGKRSGVEKEAFADGQRQGDALWVGEAQGCRPVGWTGRSRQVDSEIGEPKVRLVYQDERTSGLVCGKGDFPGAETVAGMLDEAVEPQINEEYDREQDSDFPHARA